MFKFFKKNPYNLQLILREHWRGVCVSDDAGFYFMCLEIDGAKKAQIIGADKTLTAEQLIMVENMGYRHIHTEVLPFAKPDEIVAHGLSHRQFTSYEFDAVEPED